MRASHACGVLVLALLSGCRHRATPGHRARNDARSLQPAAEKWRAEHDGRCPDVDRLRVDKEISRTTNTRDPWGTAYRIRCDAEGTAVVSLGPDRAENTADDIVVGGDDAPRADAGPSPAPRRSPAAPHEKQEIVRGPVEYPLAESGVALHVPAGVAVVPNHVMGSFLLQSDDSASAPIAFLSQEREPKSPAEHAKGACGEGAKDVVTTPIPGGGLLTSCGGSILQAGGAVLATTKVRASFPIAEKNRDGRSAAWECRCDSPNAETVALATKACASLHAVEITHAVDPEARGVKPGARCFRDSNCASTSECGAPDCKAKSGGAHEKVCRVLIEGGAQGQPCGATRSRGMVLFHEESSAYVPDTGKTVICDNVDDDLVCDRTSWTCQHPARLGASCRETGACAKDAQCRNGTCVSAAKPGESCADKECISGARCEGNETRICRTLAAVGSACVVGKNDCEHGCSGGTCAPRPARRPCLLR